MDPDGILCFLRWGDAKEPGQVERMLFLAKNALQSIGVTEVGSHIMLVTARSRLQEGAHPIGTMLVSPQSFSKEDVDKVVSIAKEEGYQLLWVPGVAQVEPFASDILKPGTDPGMPTDNRPFFFTPVRPSPNESAIAEPAQGKGLALLMFTFILSAVLVVIVIIFPAWSNFKGKAGNFVQATKSGFYFGCLGLAFMFVEVSQLQRLTLLLGNPTYGLSAVLFALLLASGIGSFTAQLLLDKGKELRKLLRTGMVAAAACIFLGVAAFQWLLPTLEASQLSERMMVALLLVSVPGFFMGWAFPLGLSLFTQDATEAGAWFWAINGSTSVLGSVLAAIVSVVFGVETTLSFGAICYIFAALASG
jgi:hypothetical protein